MFEIHNMYTVYIHSGYTDLLENRNHFRKFPKKMFEPVEEPTKERPGRINAIDKTTVHQICSGQVILNLATAVKVF